MVENKDESEYEVGDHKIGEYGQRLRKATEKGAWELDPPYDNDLCPDCKEEIDEEEQGIARWKGYIYHAECFKKSHRGPSSFSSKL